MTTPASQNLASIILPCYNEKENVLQLIEEIHALLQDKCKHEIIIVDDNSPDGTYKAVKQKNFPFVKAILRRDKPSLAGSIKKGIETAKGDSLVFMDSDYNHSPKYLPILLENLRFYDCVSATRFVYGGRSYNTLRFFLSWLFNIGVRILTRHFITDTLFGYLALKRSVLEQLNYDEIFWGHGDYCIRLMYYLQVKKFSILQIPASHEPRAHGSGNTRFFKTWLRYTIETLKLMKKRKSNYV